MDLDLSFEIQNGLNLTETGVSVFSGVNTPSTETFSGTAEIGTLYLQTNGDGYLKTGASTWSKLLTGTVSIGLSTSSAGLSVSGSPVGQSGTLTINLAGDLAALEALSLTGIATRTGSATWAVREILGTAGQIAVSNGTGVSGNPQLSLSASGVAAGTYGAAGTVPVVTVDTYGRVTAVVDTSISLSLDALSDVQITSVGSGQVLSYNGTQWVNTTPATGVTDHGALTGLGDDDHTQYVHTTTARTVSAVHTFNPGAAGAPFILGANATGQLVTGLNADTLDGNHASAFQPIDADLTAIAALATTGIVRRTAANTWSAGTAVGLTTEVTGILPSANGGTGINNGGRTLTINTNNAIISFTTAATTLTVANTASVSGTNTGDQTITLTGDVTGSGTGSFAATLATVNSSPQTDTFRKLTVNGKGLVTATSAVASADITTALGFTPYDSTNPSGYTSNAGTVTSVGVSAPAAGFTISGGPITGSGTLTFALTNDLAAVEALASTGIVRRTAADTWSAGTAVSLTAEVSGILPSANGGTGINNGGRTLTINTNSGTVSFTNASTTLTVANNASVSGTNTGDQTITLTGDVTGSGTGSFAATLATVNGAPQTDTFRKLTVNGKGLVTATSAVVAGDITTALGFTPYNATNPSGYTSNVGTVTSVGASSAGTYAAALTIGASPITGSGTFTITPNLFSSSTAGVVPASGGGTANFLRADGTWAAAGGGSAAGVTGSIQYNSGGAFAGTANLEYDPTTGIVRTEGGTTNGFSIAASTTYPAPPTDGITLASRVISGIPRLVWVEGPAGRIFAFQKAWIDSRQIMIKPGNGTVQSVFATAVTNVGTLSHPALTNTNRLTRTHRTIFTSATTAGSLTSQRTTALIASNNEMYEYRETFSLATLQSGNRGFFGLADSTTAPTNIDPTTVAAPARVGIGFNANTGNWRLISSTGSAITATDLGASFPINITDIMEITLTKAINVADVYYRIRNKTTGVSAEGVLTTNIPSTGNMLALWKFMTNNTTAAAVAFESMGVFMELEY